MYTIFWSVVVVVFNVLSVEYVFIYCNDGLIMDALVEGGNDGLVDVSDVFE